MNTATQDPLAKLYDIEGLDTISAWPPAIGWWVVLGTIVILLVLAFYWYWHRQKDLRSWRHDTLKHLQQLASQTPDHALAVELSELIRRIAIHRHSRNACAGLEGKTWLAWLCEHDPTGFDWQANGAWITTIPYAPENTQVPAEPMKATLHAIKEWVK